MVKMLLRVRMAIAVCKYGAWRLLVDCCYRCIPSQSSSMIGRLAGTLLELLY
jgi:hypothetical protein